ncbi:hydrogenase maturation protease [Desulfonatronospira sp. MSAO_Bac3]|uniref:hydrogenase maturation protease n=1 Tax=Desulfonatronospira sp. MSAO_Bac3 TaxID=2293857 RepID=UPI000FF44A21|nr:hydrogenase maturation protease [Desulfonatronospira sp. MSAO_Bac3]RQD76226.1 MAG: hydrogenase maturation protease [Desulfonatronospira sp. MSAO_Bac3]
MNDFRTIVLGIGNPLLQDDRAGLEVARRVFELGLSVDTQELYTVGFEVMDRLMSYDRAFIVDACRLGNKPGTVMEVRIEDIFSSKSLASSHAITLGATLKTAYQLFPDEMPGELRIFLIEVERIDEFTDIMSPCVDQAVQETVDIIASAISSKGCKSGRNMSCCRHIL